MGCEVGIIVGNAVGTKDGRVLGVNVGGLEVARSEGVTVGSIFSGIAVGIDVVGTKVGAAVVEAVNGWDVGALVAFDGLLEGRTDGRFDGTTIEVGAIVLDTIQICTYNRLTSRKQSS